MGILVDFQVRSTVCYYFKLNCCMLHHCQDGPTVELHGCDSVGDVLSCSHANAFTICLTMEGEETGLILPHLRQ